MLTAFAYISMERKEPPNSEMRLIARLVHLNQCSVEFHTERGRGGHWDSPSPGNFEDYDVTTQQVQ